MSYICDVCGPRLEWDSVLCNHCEAGIIFEIKDKGPRPGQKPGLSAGKDDGNRSIKHPDVTVN